MKSKELEEVIQYLRTELKIKISTKKEKMLFDKFIATKDVTNLVLWRCVCVTNERHPDDYKKQGIITKEDYEVIKKADIEPDKDICFGEIAKYVELYCYFKNISFIEDANKILDFYNQDEEDYPLLDYLEGYLDCDEEDD